MHDMDWLDALAIITWFYEHDPEKFLELSHHTVDDVLTDAINSKPVTIEDRCCTERRTK